MGQLRYSSVVVAQFPVARCCFEGEKSPQMSLVHADKADDKRVPSGERCLKITFTTKVENQVCD